MRTHKINYVNVSKGDTVGFLDPSVKVELKKKNDEITRPPCFTDEPLEAGVISNYMEAQVPKMLKRKVQVRNLRLAPDEQKVIDSELGIAIFHFESQLTKEFHLSDAAIRILEKTGYHKIIAAKAYWQHPSTEWFMEVASKYGLTVSWWSKTDDRFGLDYFTFTKFYFFCFDLTDQGKIIYFRYVFYGSGNNGVPTGSNSFLRHRIQIGLFPFRRSIKGRSTATANGRRG